MRPLLLTAALTLLLAAAAPARVFESAKLKPSGLGPLRTGMTLKQVEKTIGRNVRQFRLGRCSQGRLDGRNFLMFTNNVLRRVTLGSRQYATETGLRVGDDQGDIREVYGKRAKRESHVYNPDGFYFSVDFGKRKRIRFETDGEDITSIHAGRTPEVDYVEGCA